MTLGVSLAAGDCAKKPPPPTESQTDPPTLRIAGGEIECQIKSQPAGISRDQLVEWVRAAARAVSGYYHHFPTTRLTVVISSESRWHDINGQTYGASRIEIEFGPRVTVADLKDDWVLTHEMFHLAFPDLRESHLWMNEGLSTYLEPIARARVGNLPVERVWQQMIDGFPESQSEADNGGLNHDATWGRTYWGGCMFWLLVDIHVRQQTHNRHSLDDALRAILEAGGNGAVHWPVQRVIATADAATGMTALQDQYNQMADKAFNLDLTKFWRQMGVRQVGGHIRYDDSAPLASIRRAITAP